MLSHRKVVWSEGMFLRPQHFQQQERYQQRRLALRTQALQGVGWGFARLTLDREALAMGKLALAQAHGVFPDGTVFSFPGDDDAPAALDIPADVRDARVVLALPRQREGMVETSYDADDAGLARYGTIEAEVQDSTAAGLEPALLQLGSLRLRLALEDELSGDWLKLAVAHVIMRGANNHLVLDEDFIAPCLAADNHPVLAGFTRELAGLLDARASTLVERLAEPGRAGTAEIADYMLLETVNRFGGALAHAGQLPGIHPERLYHDWLMLAAALATHTSANRRPPELPPYRQEDLAGTFEPLMKELRRSLAVTQQRNAIQIPLHDQGQGVRVAQVQDAELLHHAGFVLAVRADMAAEALRSHFPTQVKIGPVDRIHDLVHLQLPGVTVRALPVVPRQLPYKAGHVYFELDKTGEFWRELEKKATLALHLSGEFPRLGMEFWAIRD